LQQAIALREALVKDEPNNAPYQADLAASRLSLWLARARRLRELKRTQEAEADLAKGEELKPDNAEVCKTCGRLRFELGQTDKAVADFRKAIELLGDQALLVESAASSTASHADKLFARLADDALLQRLTAAIERNPEDILKRRQRGEWYARHWRWKEAAADFTIALERDPPDLTLTWLHAVPVLVAAGDRQRYRRLCHEMLKLFHEAQDPVDMERLAKSCLLLPHLDENAESACRLA
jgi:tetratricopeptide (TPR) repeat protein